MSRRQAFAELRRRNDSEQVAMFVTALQQGEELGAPIVDTLVSLAKDMRRTDAQNARRKAARAVPKATMMITTFMVPATMLLLGAGLILGFGDGLRVGDGGVGGDIKSMTGERAGLLRRRPRTPEITTPPAGTVLPSHVRTGAPDIPVTSATPALPPGWEPVAGVQGSGAAAALTDEGGVPAQGRAPAAARGDGRAAADGGQPPQGPPALGDESRTGDAGGNSIPAEGRAATNPTSPAIDIQVNALQAMCRQVFGFRLAMIALATPAALVNADEGLPTRLVGAAVVVTFMISYVLFRDWEPLRPPPPAPPQPPRRRHPLRLPPPHRRGPGHHPRLRQRLHPPPRRPRLRLARSRRLRLPAVAHPAPPPCHAAQENPHPGLAETATPARPLRHRRRRRLQPPQPDAPLRRGHPGPDDRPGPAGRDRGGQRRTARLAREMHDSVAKTLHGVALAADGLTGTAGGDRMDPARVQPAGGTGRPLSPPGSRRIPRTPGRPAPRIRPRPGHGRPGRNSPPAPATSRPAPACPPSTAPPATTPYPPYRPRWPANSSPSPRKPWRTPTVTRHATPCRRHVRASTATCSVSASTTTDAASRPAPRSNSSAERATSAWSAWSSEPPRWAPASASAAAATPRARKSAWNFPWPP